MALNNSQLIQNLAQTRFPTQNAQAAADVGLQQAVQQSPVTPNLAQTIGTQIGQLKAQKQVANIQQVTGQLGQVGQLGVQGTQGQAQGLIQSQQLGAKKQEEQQQLGIQGISLANQKQLFTDRNQFQQNQSGLALSNSRQMTDYIALTAKNEQEFQNYKTNMEVAYDRNQALLQTAYDKLSNQLQFQTQYINQLTNQAQQAGISREEQSNAAQNLQREENQKIQLQSQLVALSKSLAQSRAQAANTQMVIGAIGTIAGAGIGVAIPGAGAVGGLAGAAIGGGLANLAGSQIKQ